jgi:hypothetical protein
LQVLIAGIVSSQFSIARLDKKAGFIEVTTKMGDEILAKLYCDRIVQEAVKRYLILKTKRQKATVDALQVRADSIMTLLNKKISTGAALQSSSSSMDINPLYRTGTSIAIETSTRDKAILTTMFAEITKNLELAKFTLSQETPVIQLVDVSDFPLKKNKVGKIRTALIFGISAGIFMTFVLVIITLIRRAMM